MRAGRLASRLPGGHQFKALSETWGITRQQILAYQWMKRRQAEGGEPLVHAWAKILADFQAALAGVLAAAPDPAAVRTENIERCEFSTHYMRQFRRPDSAPIDGCTALIGSGEKAPPVLAKAYLNRALASLGSGQNDAAITDLDHAIALYPKNDGGVYNLRGVAYSRKGQHDRALENLDQALQLAPADAVFLNNRCWERAMLGKLSEALADCNEALRAQPGNINVLDIRSIVYLKQGNNEAAIGDFDAILKKNPRSAGALYGRGLAKLRIGNKEGGNADVAEARRLDAQVAARFRSMGISDEPRP